jgi:hypothetical protein
MMFVTAAIRLATGLVASSTELTGIRLSAPADPGTATMTTSSAATAAAPTRVLRIEAHSSSGTRLVREWAAASRGIPSAMVPGGTAGRDLTSATAGLLGTVRPLTSDTAITSPA